MNDALQKFARDQLKSNLKLLPDGWQLTFKRMYSHGNIDLSVDEAVDRMPYEKLDWAMTQVEKSLAKLGNNVIGSA